MLLVLTSGTVSGAFTGTIRHSTNGNVVTLNPELGTDVDYYKFKIRCMSENYTSETPWISTDDDVQTSFALRRGDYLITMYYKNCTLSSETFDSIHIARQEEITTTPTISIVEEDESDVKSITDSIPDEVKDWWDDRNGFEKGLMVFGFFVLIMFMLFRDEKYRYYVLKRKR